MQAPRRALLYGLGIWFIWVTLVVTAVEILPAAAAGSTLFGSMRIVTLAVIVLGFTVLYLRRVGDGSLGEGAMVGLTWLAVVVALDLAHYFMVPFDIGAYFTTGVPLPYLLLPITTMLVLGYLRAPQPTRAPLTPRPTHARTPDHAGSLGA